MEFTSSNTEPTSVDVTCSDTASLHHQQDQQNYHEANAQTELETPIEENQGTKGSLAIKEEQLNEEEQACKVREEKVLPLKDEEAPERDNASLSEQANQNSVLHEQLQLPDATTTCADIDSDDELGSEIDDFESFYTPYDELDRDRSRSSVPTFSPSGVPTVRTTGGTNKEVDPLKSSKKKQHEEFLKRVEIMKTFVDNEWKVKRFEGQIQRDAETWLDTLRSPGVEARGNILRRLFTVLRYGGLLLRHSNSKDGHSKDSQWRSWYTTGWPIATALSHGGRIVIQLPKRKSDHQSKFDSNFWKWLVAGDDGQLSDYVSTSSSGDQCAKEKKLIFKRLGATHGLEFEKPMDIPAASTDPDSTYPQLPNGRKKVLVEAKTSGFNLRDTKMLRGDRHTLKYHRHWGMNIPLGGHLNRRMTIKSVKADGCNGHVYLYRMPATEHTYGGVMIGMEGSEWGKYDAVGGYHGVSAKSSPYSPTYGYKWHSKVHVDLEETGGPGKYDCMYVDLSSGWEYLKELYINDWRDEYVMQTSIPLPSDPCYKEFLENMESVVQARIVSLQRLSRERRRHLQQSLRTRHAGKFEASHLSSRIILHKSRYIKIKAERPYKTYEDIISEMSKILVS